MQGINVAVSGMEWKGVTDASGNFDFGDVPAGNYTVTGQVDAKSTQASQTLAAPAGTITTFNLIMCAIKVEIQINNTGTANDDIVQVKCDHPAHRHKVPCQIKLVSGAAHDHQITLGNPDGRLRFPEVGDTTKNVTLPVSGTWVAFEISGESGSAAIGDAVIEARLAATCPDGGASAVGDLKGTKPGTVFWFDTAQMTLTQGGNYSLTGGTFRAAGVAVSFSAQAAIKPTGVDCTAPQVKDLRISIMQETSNQLITVNWSSPVATWNAAAPHPTSVTVSTNVRQTITFNHGIVTEPVNDGVDGAYPLYSQSANALKPPGGCAGSAAATSNDNPGQTGLGNFVRNLTSGATIIGTATWSLVNVTRRQDFRTFCVVFNTVTQTYCSLRQATWSLNLDSAGAAADQHAVVTADAAASADPATGTTANHAELVNPAADFGAATTVLNNP